MSRPLARALLVVVLGTIALGALATPASAHTISGPRPSNYRTRIVSVTPDVPGITVRVVDLGSRLELTNHTDTDVVVRGPEGEPYLRVGPSGVYENVLSPATYINRTRSGQTAVPPEAANARPSDPPKWHKVSSGQTARWHDHRVHWMAGQAPPPVQQHPDQFFSIGEWHVVMDHGNQRITVAGTLDWVPGPNGLKWWPLAIVLFAIGLLAGLWKRGWRVMAALIGLLVLVDIAHAVAYEAGRGGGLATKLGQFFGGNIASIVVWLAAIAVVIGLVKRRTEALYGAILVAMMVALVGGATDLSALWKSQLVNVGPGWLTRAEVVIALALGFGVAVGALVRVQRSERRARAGPSGWLSLLIEGLDDAELERIAAELDADEVLEVAMADAARRAAPAAGALASGSLVISSDGSVWSIAASDGAVRAERGRAEPVGAELRCSFATLLKVLAGTEPVDASAVLGDVALVEQLAPYLPEGADVTPVQPDHASAS